MGYFITERPGPDDMPIQEALYDAEGDVAESVQAIVRGGQQHLQLLNMVGRIYPHPTQPGQYVIGTEKDYLAWRELLHHLSGLTVRLQIEVVPDYEADREEDEDADDFPA